MSKPRHRWFWAVSLLVLMWLISGLWQIYKPLPEGLDFTGPWRSAEAVRFYSDQTFINAKGVRQSEQAIFDTALEMIRGARQLIVLDMFLFNEFGASTTDVLRPLSDELSVALIAQKHAHKALRVIVITDPINTVYGGLKASHLARMKAAGIDVVETDLTALRASNALWSGLWSLCCQWFGNNDDGGWLPNPLGEGQVTLRSWLALPNFRANHRKTLIVDADQTWQALVTSANPHDASSAHGNVALQFSGAAVLDLMASEAAVLAFSGGRALSLPEASLPKTPTESRLRVLTESAISRALIARIDHAKSGEMIDVAVFYLASKKLKLALIAAQQRGVRVRVLLDPNEDAFGRKKNGVPNRQMAAELVAAGIEVRWCDTHGEQCHAKVLLHRGKQEQAAILGSANFTRRNLENLNLETSVEWHAPKHDEQMVLLQTWFDNAWHNTPEQHFSIDYAHYKDEGFWRRAWYQIGEAWGLSTW